MKCNIIIIIIIFKHFLKSNIPIYIFKLCVFVTLNDKIISSNISNILEAILSNIEKDIAVSEKLYIGYIIYMG